jgi:hypothetical protein
LKKEEKLNVNQFFYQYVQYVNVHINNIQHTWRKWKSKMVTSGEYGAKRLHFSLSNASGCSLIREKPVR